MLSGTGGIQFASHENPEIGTDSGHLAGLPLRLLQPERHAHLAVHGHAASAPGAAGVRVWQTTSTGSEARDRRPPPDGDVVDYPRYPGAALATDYLSWCSSSDGEDSARRPSPRGTVALNSRAHSGRIAPRWRRRSAVLCRH